MRCELKSADLSAISASWVIHGLVVSGSECSESMDRASRFCVVCAMSDMLVRMR